MPMNGVDDNEKKGSRCIWCVLSPGMFFFFWHPFTLLTVILLIGCCYTIWGPNNTQKRGSRCIRCILSPGKFFFLCLFYVTNRHITYRILLHHLRAKQQKKGLKMSCVSSPWYVLFTIQFDTVGPKSARIGCGSRHNASWAWVCFFFTINAFSYYTNWNWYFMWANGSGRARKG